MTRKYIIVADDSIDGFDGGIEKLEREWGAEEIDPCEDCISRQAATKAIREDGTWLESQGCTEITMVERKQRDADILGELPSVTPQPKAGEWIDVWNKNDCDISTQARCNRCKQLSNRPLGNFCKWCGAKMEVGK